MATILQCKLCNKPFQSMGGKICPTCLDQIDLDFITIRDYIYDNPGSFDLDKICEATEVDKKIALHLLKEGRLVISGPDGGGALTCSMCGRAIASGAMCDDCKTSLSSTLGSAVVTPPKPEKTPLPSRNTAKMHVRRNEKDPRRR